MLLLRHATTTDVMLVSSSGGAPLPCASPQGDESQRSLVEGLIRESRVGAVDRLYASPLAVAGGDGPLGLFVAFVGEESSAAPAGEWTDLREACRALAPLWAGVLSDVRERFVARPPDEALRIA